MRRGVGILAAVAAVVAAASARAQDPEPRYWPLREINFPVPVEKIQAMSPRPAKLRFWVARDRGRFKMEAEKTVADLDVIDAEKNRRGFIYTSPADGAYEFALQFEYADGDRNPRDSEITAQYRYVFDTRPPLVRLAAVGAAGVEWSVEDENLAPDGVQLEVRWQGTSKWTPVNRRALAARDRYTWNADEIKRVLEVRVVGRDRAGLEMASRVVTLPSAGSPTGLGDGGRIPADRTGSGFGGPDDFTARPEVQYVNTTGLTVESKLTRLTRSGVKAAELWVNDGKTGWKKATTKPESIRGDAVDPVIKIPYKAEKDGLYGFIVIPVNGAGGKQDDPRPNDPAQILVHVDTEKPVVQVKNVKVSPGGAAGPRVEIEWQVTETNLMPDPIVLEYMPYADDKPTGTWKPIAVKVANTGRYVWEVEDKTFWKFQVRAAAVDRAGNRGEHVYEKEVGIDLEKPAATIEKVHGGNDVPSGRRSPTQDPSPEALPPIQGNPPSVPMLPNDGK
jgi:hypothetical protein